MVKNATGALALCLVAATAHAQPAYRVKDIEPGPGSGSRPDQFTAVGDVTYFTATDPGNGREVWRTDGTAAGTRLLKDIAPGPSTSSPRELTAFAGALFFVANGGLWRSNGSTLGTVGLRSDLSQVDELTPYAGRLYFVAYDDARGQELWSTDGTDTGTALVKDISPGSSAPSELVPFGGFLFFAAAGPGGRELWRSDGTDAGTVQVHDAHPGPGGSRPEGLSIVGSRLHFSADDGTHGREPWTTALDSGVTAIAHDVEPGAEGSFPEQAGALGGIAYFSAYTDANGVELWRSDGTPAGTWLLKDMDPGSSSSFPQDFVPFAGALYFGAEDGDDYQLWRTDGTAAGTVPVNPAAVLPFELTVSGDTLFFSAEDSTHGRELWRSDGTAAGTQPIDLIPGVTESDPRNLRDVAGRLFFGARPPGRLAFVFEPWTSDGTPAGTAQLAALGGGASSVVQAGIDLGGVFYFPAAGGGHGLELWRSDGSEAGTWLVRDLLPGPSSSIPEDLTVVNGVLFFHALDDREHRVLWRSDGTAAGTVKVTSPGHPLSSVRGVARAGSVLFLAGFDAVHGDELWKSDGTSAGTVLVRDLSPGFSGNPPLQMTDVNGTLFFAGYDAAEGYSLWKSDGTEAGTVRVDIILPGTASASLVSLTAVGGVLFFAADDGLHGQEPWVSDGTPLGTRQVRDVRLGPDGSLASGFVGAGGLAFFYANDGTSGYELWRTDGTEAGTIRLGDIRPGGFGSDPLPRTPLGNLLIFGADDGVSGRELWRSDGTVAGTVRVRDIAVGPEPSLADAVSQTIVEWGGFAYFAAASGSIGHELWRTDGTPEGTLLLQDIVPGPPSSGFVPLLAAGGRLFARAADAAGAELWAVRPELTAASATAAEGTHALVDVALVPRLDVPLAVPFTTVDNSAVGDSDFQPKSGVLTFVPGETLQTVDVTVLDDVTHEPVEQFFVDLAPGPNAFAARPRGIVTVTDDDPQPLLTAGDAAVVEGDAGTADATFTVRLSPVSATTVTVAYTTAPGTAGADDFVAAAGAVTFPPGATARTVAVAAVGDVLDEPDEFFFLRLSDAAGAAVASGGVGRIADDDGASLSLAALDRGQTVRASLEAAPGPAADVDLYALESAPFSSYEITVDGASGDVGDAGPSVELVSADLGTAVPSVASGVGHARALRTLNDTAAARLDYVRVRSLDCTTDCGADDTYRVRVRETTLRAARFNESGGQRSVLILQNRGEAPVKALASWWRADGTRLAGAEVVLAPRGTALVATPAAAASASGSITVAHDGALGAVVGKAVSLDQATGLAFDTPLEPRPR